MPYRLSSKHHGNDIVGQNTDGPAKKHAPEQVEKADFAQALLHHESLWMDHDLQDRASPAEGLNLGTPSQAREKQARHKEEVPTEQQREPEKHPHNLDLSRRLCPRAPPTYGFYLG
jgi:hypothetical protein